MVNYVKCASEMTKFYLRKSLRLPLINYSCEVLNFSNKNAQTEHGHYVALRSKRLPCYSVDVLLLLAVREAGGWRWSCKDAAPAAWTCIVDVIAATRPHSSRRWWYTVITSSAAVIAQDAESIRRSTIAIRHFPYLFGRSSASVVLVRYHSVVRSNTSQPQVCRGEARRVDRSKVEISTSRGTAMASPGSGRLVLDTGERWPRSVYHLTVTNSGLIAKTTNLAPRPVQTAQRLFSLVNQSIFAKFVLIF